MRNLTTSGSFTPFNDDNSCTMVQHEYFMRQVHAKLLSLQRKYTQLERLHYSLYIESFSDISLCENSYMYIKKYHIFKTLCRLLDNIKNIMDKTTTIPKVLLGIHDINQLIKYEDIKVFMDTYNLYPLIYSNYDPFEDN